MTSSDDPDSPMTLPEIDIQIESAVVKATQKSIRMDQAVNVEVARIQFDGPLKQFSIKDGYSLRYQPNEHGGGDALVLNLPGKMVNFPPEDVIKVARDMQAKQRQAPEDVADVDHQNLLDDLLKHSGDDDGTIQVLEGGVDDVKLEHFSGSTTTSILELIHFIQANNLQDQKPWCVVWNLYRCMMIAAGRS
jgi:hypothetical protein